MSLYEFTRRTLANPQETPLRWGVWWKAAIPAARGLYIEKALSHLLNDIWVVDDVTAGKALSFFRRIPGWREEDGFGAPLAYRQLSPQEEREAVASLPEEERGIWKDACVCPPDAPRKNRRAAERAFQKLEKKKRKKAGVTP